MISMKDIDAIAEDLMVEHDAKSLFVRLHDRL